MRHVASKVAAIEGGLCIVGKAISPQECIFWMSGLGI